MRFSSLVMAAPPLLLVLCLPACTQILGDPFEIASATSTAASSAGGGTGAAGSGGAAASGGAGGGDDPCGNGELDAGETCDGDCPTACLNPDLCVGGTMQGSPDTCDAQCSFSPIVTCMGGDGCCPAGCGSTNDYDCNMQVMVIGADSQANIDYVANALAATGVFGPVTTFNAQFAAVPTAAQLTPIRAVFVYSNGGLGDPAPLGDAMADFFDTGGRRVVLANGANCHQTFRIRGRFEDDGYHLFQEGGVYPNSDTIGAILVPESPLLTGVDTMLTLKSVHCAADLATGAEAVATFRTTGAAVAAVGQINGTNRVDVNVFVGNSANGDIDTPGVLPLIVNALRYPLSP